MKPYLLYANHGGDDIIRNARPLHRMAVDFCQDVNQSDLAEISRREFVRRAGLIIPAIVLGGGLFAPRSARAGSTILQRTINSATEIAVSMSNTTWARPITLPGSWSKIRMAIMGHINGTGATLAGLTTLAFGFCSGTTGQYGDASTTHFIGAAAEGASSLAWGPCSGQPFYAFTPPPIARKRVGTTNTDTATLDSNGCGTMYMGARAGSNIGDRTMVFIDITKGSPNYTFHLPFCSTTCCSVPPLNNDMTSAKFLLYAGQTNPAPTEQSYQSTPTDRTIAVNEGSDGTLNAINVAWNRADAPLELTDIAVAVLA